MTEFTPIASLIGGMMKERRQDAPDTGGSLDLMERWRDPRTSRLTQVEQTAENVFAAQQSDHLS